MFVFSLFQQYFEIGSNKILSVTSSGLFIIVDLKLNSVSRIFFCLYKYHHRDRVTPHAVILPGQKGETFYL